MSIFYDGQPGPEVREQLNALYDAFAGSAYPPTAGMFAPGTLSAPSVRGTADPSTGWNFLNGEAQLSVGGVLKARATAAGFLDATDNPLLSAANAVGSLSEGSIIERGNNANGEYVKFADGTLMCSARLTVGPTNNINGGIFMSSLIEWYFPASSVNIPSLSCNFSNPMEDNAGWVASYRHDGYSANFYLFSPTSIDVEDRSVSVALIGRWK